MASTQEATPLRSVPSADRAGVQARVNLSPIAAPSILGLFGFMGATLMVGANLAHWFGTPTSPLLLFPFAMMLGGLAQFLAGMWSYKARDGIATAMHGTWGSFWLGYGVLQLLFATHVLTPPAPGAAFPELGWWFVSLAAITGMGAIAALFENFALFTVLGVLTGGCVLAAIGFNLGNSSTVFAAGWVFVASAAAAWYTAGAMMLEGAAGRVVLPLGKYNRDANTPGRTVTTPVQYEWAEPGIRKGQ
jgi:uncharacterized protein